MAQKRLQITDATTGWTHVTTSGKARRCARTTKDQQSQSQFQSPTEEEKEPETFHPAEAPPTTTLDSLKSQFTQIQRTWKESTTCDVVGRTLHNIFLPPQLQSRELNTDNTQPQSHTTTENKHNGIGTGIDSIICIGLGSPSGFLRGGWVDRRLVSLYQLAALVDVIASISSSSSSAADPTIKTYAQDPVFNTLDTALLSSLDITVLESPHAFEKVTPRTFLFCPGAERTHLEQLLALDPAFVFGGPLEDVESEVVSAFVKRRGSVRLPLFEAQEHAFWNMRVYYPLEKEGEE
ncbi:similar to An07g04640 [Aspergillus luchuensis]|uniref:Similar to An07g04640 n=1 Tax=Aspergillus kawachii TaxID=1069201 RepID=A0A146F1J6_ASPKA|nr:similar to An07g04640 [Aspergillus luchuensis]